MRVSEVMWNERKGECELRVKVGVEENGKWSSGMECVGDDWEAIVRSGTRSTKMAEAA